MEPEKQQDSGNIENFAREPIDTIFEGSQEHGAVHILLNTEGRQGGLTKRYHCVFLLYNPIKILTESVTQGGGGVKNGPFWRYVICGWPLSKKRKLKVKHTINFEWLNGIVTASWQQNKTRLSNMFLQIFAVHCKWKKGKTRRKSLQGTKQYFHVQKMNNLCKVHFVLTQCFNQSQTTQKPNEQMQNHCHNLGTNNFQSEITITEQLYQSTIPVIIHGQVLMQLLTIVRPTQAISLDKDKLYMSLALPIDAIQDICDF